MANRNQRRGGPAKTQQAHLEEIRHAIATNLCIDVDFVRYDFLERPSKIGSVGKQWQIKWRGQWCELPWHFDGPTRVTWDLIRKWYGA